MSFFGKNLKKIRTVKKLSQSAFADIFNLKRGSIAAYEEKRAEAKIDTIISIAEYFKLSLDQLLRTELTINEIYHLDSYNKKFYHSKSNIKENGIPYISIINKNKFIRNYENDDFLDQLPKICMPHVKQNFIAFECFDSSMLGQFSGIKQGDVLIAQLIKLDDLNNNQKQNMIIVLRRRELIIGLPEIISEELILHPLNNNFQKHHVDIRKIKKLWMVKKIITDSFLKGDIYEKRIQNIEKQIDTLKMEILNLKSKT